MIYKGTKDGFSAFNFHMKCDSRGPTITLVKSASNNEIFGGYSSISWSSSQFRWVRDDKSFLFTLSDGGKMFPQNSNSADCAVYHHNDLLVAFGQGHDLCLASNCNQNTNSYCRLVSTYRSSAQDMLGGDYNFRVDEIETYQVLMSEIPQI